MMGFLTHHSGDIAMFIGSLCLFIIAELGIAKHRKEW